MFGRFWIVFRVMGLAAFQSTEAPFRRSWPTILSGYALALSAVSTICYLMSSSKDRFKGSYKNSQTAQIVILIDKVTLMITSLVCILSATVNTKNLFHVMNKFEHDRVLKNYASHSQKRFKKGLLLLLFLILLVTCELIHTSSYTNLIPLFYLRISSTKHIHSFDWLREISAAHWMLCMLGNDINGAFNGQLMAIFFAVFARIVTRPYFIFLSLEYIVVDPYYVIVNTGWVLVYWLKLCLPVWACSLATNEARSTLSVIVHNLNQPLPPENRKLMEMFLLQLTNHKLNFTVYRMFTIDLTVLTSVAGAVSTYLVILIQFQNSQA
ncbi:hypothetical protein GE061_002725 [Apolygus lucorum]|uniref:Gustatory receptor n=1 Tax=Apolygus lucorum TaxID=248454 RepID=A0A8S9X7A9_APOLU|nr:hypothetical protein GE061_002725 [Apolygus lucorum]